MNNKNPHGKKTKVYKQSRKPQTFYDPNVHLPKTSTNKWETKQTISEKKQPSKQQPFYDSYMHFPKNSSTKLEPKDMILEAKLNKYALKIHGINDGFDDFSSDSDSGKSEFDEEYYKYKPGPIVVDPKNLVVIEKVETPSEQPKNRKTPKNKNKTKIQHQTLSDQKPITYRSVKREEIPKIISNKNNHGSMENDNRIEKPVTRENIVLGTNKPSTSINLTQSVHATQRNISLQGPMVANEQFINRGVLPFSDSNKSAFNTLRVPSISTPQHNLNTAAQFEQKTKGVSQNKVLVHRIISPPKQTTSSHHSPKQNTENMFSIEKHAAHASGSSDTHRKIDHQEPPKPLQQSYSSPVGSYDKRRNRSVTPSSVLSRETSHPPYVSNDIGGVVVVEDGRQDSEAQFFGEYESCCTKFYKSFCCAS